MNFLVIAICLAASNFGYQYFHNADWPTAFERTWFQSFAILACWLSTMLVSRPHRHTPNEETK